MSILHLANHGGYVLQCDAPACAADFVSGCPCASRDEAHLRWHAREYRWSASGKDLCPEHKETR